MAERDNFVPVKFPIYLGEAREREVDGNLMTVQPFVEQWRIFDLPGSKFSKQVHLGLRIVGMEDIFSGGDPNEPDPIRLYRALQILDRFEYFPMNQDHNTPLITRLHFDIGDAYAAAGRSYPLGRHHYFRDRLRSFIGDDSFNEAVQMIPPNLTAVVENLYRQKVTINGETLVREINRGRIEATPLYEAVISKTGQRRQRDKKSAERFQKSLGTLSL